MGCNTGILLLLLCLAALHISASPLAARFEVQRHPQPSRRAVNASVYVCQNYDWNPPCLLLPLGSDNNGQENFWMAPAPTGPGPFRNGNYTIGSWGPSEGVSTVWEDNHGNKTSPITYPGTAHIDLYWTTSVWLYWPSWVEN